MEPTHDELIAALGTYMEAYQLYERTDMDRVTDDEYTALAVASYEAHEALCMLWSRHQEAKARRES